MRLNQRKNYNYYESQTAVSSHNKYDQLVKHITNEVEQ